MKIAIASGKGGTGKTTLAVNLAVYINKFISDKVVLVDLDVEEPNLALFTKGKIQLKENVYVKVPKWDNCRCVFCEKCSSICNFNAIATLPDNVVVFPELCHSCYACSELCESKALPMHDHKIGCLNHYKINENMCLVEGVTDIGRESAVPLIQQVKQHVNESFNEEEIKIFDCPPGTACPAIEAVKDSGLVVLVTEPTPFGLHDLKLAVKTVESLNLNTGVVINRDERGNSGVEDYCKNNNILLLGKIPEMREAAVLYSKGKLLNEIVEIQNEIKNIWMNITNVISI